METRSGAQCGDLLSIVSNRLKVLTRFKLKLLPLRGPWDNRSGG